MNRRHGMDMGMDGMGGGMDMGSSECSMDMLGNWKSNNICILTSSWHIKSTAQFVGTCIAIFLIVFLIEAIRRWGREWDRYIVRKALQDRIILRMARAEAAAAPPPPPPSSTTTTAGALEKGNESAAASAPTTPGESASSLAHQPNNNSLTRSVRAPLSHNRTLARIESAFFGVPASASARTAALNRARFRPTVLQQFIRSLVYAVQFAGAYIVMLIAMTFNGYILIAIILGGFAGHFVSTWDNLSNALDPDAPEDDDPLLMSMGLDSSHPVQAQAQLQARAEERASRLGHGADQGVYGSGACCG
ncbi:copper transporter complex subunit Ctr4 [Tilletia horrida]|nr:copper transporter complex subunit Ctr4 [Tilletia horrida]